MARATVLAIALVALVALAGCDSSSHGASARAGDIDMSTAKTRSCREPAPGAKGSDPVLARVFTVTDGTHTGYLLGWQLVPYRGTARTYEFGKDGNVLALEPAAGGRPLGYGNGTVTLAATPDSGTIHASITLKTGGSISVAGTWRCS